MLKRLLSRFLLVLLGVIFALVAVEVLLRLYPLPNRFAFDRQQVQLWQPDDELLLHLKPNLNMQITAHAEFRQTIHTNSEGLRNEEFSGAYDVVAVGDSFTFGFGVEDDEPWPKQLEAISNLRVANLGWSGWNSYVYPRTIERHAIPLGAKVWVWAFFVNDLHESAGAESFLTSGRTNFLDDYNQQNALPPLLNFRLMEVLATIVYPDLVLLDGSGSIIFENEDYKMRLSYHPWELSDPQNADTERGWALTEAALMEAQQMAVEQDVGLVVMVIPPREQVYWPIVGDYLPDADVQQLDAVADRLEAITAEQGINYFNLLPGFQERAQMGEMLYFPADGHWNQAGHTLAAQLLYDYLTAMGLID